MTLQETSSEQSGEPHEAETEPSRSQAEVIPDTDPTGDISYYEIHRLPNLLQQIEERGGVFNDRGDFIPAPEAKALTERAVAGDISAYDELSEEHQDCVLFLEESDVLRGEVYDFEGPEGVQQAGAEMVKALNAIAHGKETVDMEVVEGETTRTVSMPADDLLHEAERNIVGELGHKLSTPDRYDEVKVGDRDRRAILRHRAA